MDNLSKNAFLISTILRGYIVSTLIRNSTSIVSSYQYFLCKDTNSIFRREQSKYEVLQTEALCFLCQCDGYAVFLQQTAITCLCGVTVAYFLPSSKVLFICIVALLPLYVLFGTNISFIFCINFHGSSYLII